jgi:hypothetical protein
MSSGARSCNGFEAPGRVVKNGAKIRSINSGEIPRPMSEHQAKNPGTMPSVLASSATGGKGLRSGSGAPLSAVITPSQAPPGRGREAIELAAEGARRDLDHTVA